MPDSKPRPIDGLTPLSWIWIQIHGTAVELSLVRDWLTRSIPRERFATTGHYFRIQPYRQWTDYYFADLVDVVAVRLRWDGEAC